MSEKRLTFILLSTALLGAGLGGCGAGVGAEESPVAMTDLRYVGASVCAGCHEDQASSWRDSHHALAMQVPTGASILGAFDDTEFDHNGITSRFFRRGDEYLVETEGRNGKPDVFPVRYTFGVEPLQQYLLELPDGRMQALSASWDSRPAEEGGQNWFHVYGDELIAHNDVLHWTQPSQNWDSMCAYCHSTGLKRSFDTETRKFATTWAEINVACEACHGPGSRHVESPRSGDERSTMARIGLDACAACHSRRSQISDRPLPGDAYLNNFRPMLIQSPLYHVDGQIHDEVYVYGSFLQSRMHQAGVTCGDCHDPHSLQLRAPGSDVCLRCHEADQFAKAGHHLHSVDSPGANCIDCHMPTTTYMQVDARHDHSFRIPRPDLSAKFGTPDACTNCHENRQAAWAVDVLRAAGKLHDDAHWQEKLATILSKNTDAREAILDLSADQNVPAIVRASAIVQARRYDDPLLIEWLATHADSGDPLIRWAIARLLQFAPAPLVAEFGPALVEDSVKAVRIAAANALAPVDPELLPPHMQNILQAALDEYVEAELVANERAEAHTNIGNLWRKRDQLDAAERAFRLAIELNPCFVPAHVNLADLYREQEREADSEGVLKRAIERLPDQPSLHYALGLSLYRQGRADAARAELLLAASSDEAEPRMALAYALIIDAQGEVDAAIDYLESSLDRFKNDPVLLSTLTNLYRRTGRDDVAEALSEKSTGR